MNKKQKIWNEESVRKLIELYPNNSNKDIAKALGINEKSINNKSRKIKLYKSDNYNKKLNDLKLKWKEEKIIRLIEMFPNNSDKYIAEELKITKDAVTCKARQLKLYKSDEYKSQSRITVWNKEKIEKLIDLYPNMRNEDIAKEFSLSQSSIENKALRLGLIKTSEFIGKMIGKRNKMVGRDLTFDLLKEIALKYKTRGEFQYGDGSAYSTARIAGFLPEICKHMTVMKFSIPQLILKDILDFLLESKSIYNDRKTIKPYEIDIYYPNLNLAFEYQGKAWHKDNNKDLIKFNIFNEKNINIIYIIENNRRYEEDIKNQLIQKIDEINKICNTKIKKDEIINYVIGNIYLKLYNKEELISIAKSYNSFKEFVKLEKQVYSKLSKMKLLDESTIHMKDRKRRHTDERMKKTIEKYEFLKDLIENDFSTYSHIKKNKKEYLISHLKYKNKGYCFSIELIENTIKKYTTKYRFKKENKSIYSFIIGKKLTHMMSGLKNRCKD